MTKIIITGINGFVGKHLTKELANHGITVIGVGREDNIDSNISSGVSAYYCQDIAKAWPTIDGGVDAVINLAGLAAVGASFDYPQDYININSSIVTNICEHYMQQEKKPRIISIASGAVYSSLQKMPITEKSSTTFNSPYVISKILNENQLEYYRSRGLDCISVRPFNHIGPGQLPGFIIPDLIEKLTFAKNNNISLIKTGDLKTKRDYTDVRDVARAYRLLATTPKLSHSIYNVCSGKSNSGSEIFENIKKDMKIENIEFEIDSSMLRPNDPRDIFGDYSLLNNDTGWQPKIKLAETLSDIIHSL